MIGDNVIKNMQPVQDPPLAEAVLSPKKRENWTKKRKLHELPFTEMLTSGTIRLASCKRSIKSTEKVYRAICTPTHLQPLYMHTFFIRLCLWAHPIILSGPGGLTTWAFNKFRPPRHQQALISQFRMCEREPGKKCAKGCINLMALFFMQFYMLNLFFQPRDTCKIAAPPPSLLGFKKISHLEIHCPKLN